jgi:Right handed beta helix region
LLLVVPERRPAVRAVLLGAGGSAVLAVVLALVGCGASHAAASMFVYVAPGGDDTAAGTLAAPVRTPQRAQELERAALHDGARTVTVVLRGGTYRLAAPLRFDASDSPPPHGHVVWRAYPDEHPVLSGGREIRGFTIRSDGKWVASVPPGPGFRELYLNGVRLSRASGAIPDGWLQPTARGYRVTPGTLLTWRNPLALEFVYDDQWTELRELIASRHGDEIVMHEPAFANARAAFKIEQPTYIDNAFELLDNNGEWYFDPTEHRVYLYPPVGGVNLYAPTAVAVVPRLQQLVVGAGTLESPVHDLSFVGLTFADAGWRGVEQAGGWSAIQAEFAATKKSAEPGVDDPTWRKMGAAVDFTGAHDVLFQDDTFTRLGGAGLALARGSRGDVVAGSTFTGIAGNGIELGDVTDFKPRDPREVVSDIAIVANAIHDVGVEYAGSVGIWAGYVRRTVIAWNTLDHLPYSAISVGWGWGRRDGPGNPAGHNTIANNAIRTYLAKLPDGGGVYMLGKQPGTVISGNMISGQKHPGGGLYLDDGSRGERVTGNAVFGTGGAPFTFKGHDLTIEGNYWEQADGGFGWTFYGGGGVVKGNVVIVGRAGVPEEVLAGAGRRAFTELGPGRQCAVLHAPQVPAAQLEWRTGRTELGKPCPS